MKRATRCRERRSVGLPFCISRYRQADQIRRAASDRVNQEVLFLVLFVGAAGLCIYLSITMSRRVQAGINRWCENDRHVLETQLRQIAYGEARVELERWRQEQEQTIRLDAVQRSVAVTKGKVTEHIVPYLPGFDLDPKDVRFLGTPIDLIAFSGLNASEDVEIVFIEVKTGQSTLSPRERAVKKAVEAKRVSWRVINPDLEVGRHLARV
jgi:predicted Holliday junction resolvase-like endonuclease